MEWRLQNKIKEIMQVNKKIIVAIVLAMAITQTSYATEDTTQTPTLASEAEVGTATQAKFDVEYVENGVRVIIPKLLPSLPDGNNAAQNVNTTDTKLIEEYLVFSDYNKIDAKALIKAQNIYK